MLDIRPIEKRIARIAVLTPFILLPALYFFVLSSAEYRMSDIVWYSVISIIWVVSSYIAYCFAKSSVRPAAIASAAVVATCWQVLMLLWYRSLIPQDCCGDMGQGIAILVNYTTSLIAFIATLIAVWRKPKFLKRSPLSAALGATILSVFSFPLMLLAGGLWAFFGSVF